MKYFVLACSVCFGDPNSLTSKGISLAVLFLLGVVGFVLAAILFIAISWHRRAKELPSAVPMDALSDNANAKAQR